MFNSLPYKVEYSFGSQLCRKCSQIIEANRLLIAIMMQSDEDDCHYPEWYHQSCFFSTRHCITEAVFDGFALLRYADQLSLKRYLGIIDTESPTQKAKLPDFSVEYTRNCRDPCTGCGVSFLKGEIRIMKVVYGNPDDTSLGQATWYHVYCFASLRNELGWVQSAESLPKFSRLAEEDKASLLLQIPMIKREFEVEPDNVDVDWKELEKSIAEQNEEYYAIYDTIVSYIAHHVQVELLKANQQFVPNTNTGVCHQLTDMLCFGALKPCPRCKQGQLQFYNYRYICTHISKWDKCDYSTKEPERFIPMNIAILLSLQTAYPINIVPTAVRKRELHCFRLTDENGVDLVNAPYVQPPLFNMEFVIVGNLEKPRNEIEKQIRKLGGKIGTTIHRKVAAVISNHEEIKNMGIQMVMAESAKIQVVSIDFLSEAQNTDPIVYILTESLDDWGGDPYKRIEQNNLPTRRSSISYTESVPTKVTYKWKNGTAVDPDFNYDDKAEVFCEQKGGSLLKYSVVLALVDIENDKNSYYRIQLLNSEDMKTFWVFESWGRISTVIGSKKCTSFVFLKTARVFFETIYRAKTGNRFGVKRFTKHPNQYYQLDIDFGDKKCIRPFVGSRLCPTVYGLMELIYDSKKVEDMMMLGCDVDVSQMPLGKIGAVQIRRSMTVLKEISKYIRRNGTMGQLRDASNRFYTMIPHAFGVKRPPIIDSIDVVQSKFEMLESLQNMELVYKFSIGEHSVTTNPLDACYLKMNTEITAIQRNSYEFEQFYHMVRDSHGPTHKDFVLEVLEAFKIHRAEDDQQFERYKHLPYRQLLWHGSRLTNFVSILSNGLKIAPTDAIITGAMFGKGIYFADIVSKSAQYCHVDPDSTGLLMLCEVALGTSRQLIRGQYVTDIPNAYEQSVMGVGTYYSTFTRTIDGLPVAAGQIQATALNQAAALLYNEYIVYDPAQVKIKYLFKVKFHKRPLHWF